MSNVKMELKGMDELLRRIEEMGKKGVRVSNEALIKGAEPILEEAKRTTVFSDKTGKLREGLSLGKIKTTKGVKSIEIGIQKSDNSKIFYGKFLEFGTSKMAARPFLSPAFNSKKKLASEIIKSELRRGIGL